MDIGTFVDPKRVRVSELIACLQAAMQQHGDILVYCDRDAGYRKPEPRVKFFSGEPEIYL